MTNKKTKKTKKGKKKINLSVVFSVGLTLVLIRDRMR